MAMSRSMLARANAAAIRGETKGVAQLRALEAQIRGDLWNRWLALAQKRALIWWRDRTVPPGLAARFTDAGVSYYGFGNRLRKPSSLRPFYHVNGDLQRMLLKRKPRTPRASLNGNIVQTVLKFGGGALNFMMSTSKPDMRPVTGWSRSSRTVTESFSVSGYTRSTKSGSVTVAAYAMSRSRTLTKATPVRSGETHGALFGRFNRDAPAIQARVAVEMRRIIRASAYDRRTGLIKSSAAIDADMQETAA